MSAETLHTVKMVHVALALTSACGFGLRATWIVLGLPEHLRRRSVRIVPHVVDTLLLGAGVLLAVGYSLSPIETPWFAAKLLALAAYVFSGGITVRRGRRGQPVGPWMAVAFICLALIFASALTHRPLGLPL